MRIARAAKLLDSGFFVEERDITILYELSNQ